MVLDKLPSTIMFDDSRQRSLLKLKNRNLEGAFGE